MEDKETAKVENPAIKDSLGVYHATFKLEKGKRILSALTKEMCKRFLTGKQNISGTNESTDETTFTVDNIDAKGNYEISMTLVGKKNVCNSQGKPKR